MLIRIKGVWCSRDSNNNLQKIARLCLSAFPRKPTVVLPVASPIIPFTNTASWLTVREGHKTLVASSLEPPPPHTFLCSGFFFVFFATWRLPFIPFGFQTEHPSCFWCESILVYTLTYLRSVIRRDYWTCKHFSSHISQKRRSSSSGGGSHLFWSGVFHNFTVWQKHSCTASN